MIIERYVKLFIRPLIFAILVLYMTGCSFSFTGEELYGMMTENRSGIEEEGKEAKEDPATGDPKEEENNEPLSLKASVSEVKDYNSVRLSLDADEFNGAGFKYGDSCDVLFESGFFIEDVPYFNGYYGKTGDPMLVAYPGFDYVEINYCNKGGIWDASGSKEGDHVTITLAEPGKYMAVQESMSLVYSFDREDYKDDETFVNFRALSGGLMAKDTFYRGASPVDDRFNRAATADRLLSEYGIAYIVDLADNEEDMEGFLDQENFESEYTKGLYSEGKDILLGMSANYRGEQYGISLVKGLRDMMSHDGPYYIHCLEGKDRTGFVCILLEALCGASYEEIKEDYMLTYAAYYGVTEENNPETYAAVVDIKLNDIVPWLAGISEDSDLYEASFEDGAKRYLMNAGMTEEEIDNLVLFREGQKIR